MSPEFRRSTHLFTSESVTMGHPDKVADQISDAILDHCLSADPMSRVACETMVTTDLAIVSGEITTTADLCRATVDKVVRSVIKEIGYTDPNIGFAADTPNGLVVPVIKNADQKGVLQLAREMAELSVKAREGKLGPADMQGGCFSISSLGGIGGTAFTPIINAPEVAILGVSKSALKPVWDGKQFAPRLTLPLSLSYDHRVVDGASAARFTAYLASLLADMRRVVL